MKLELNDSRQELVLLDVQDRVIAVGGPFPHDESWMPMTENASALIEDARVKCGLHPQSAHNSRAAATSDFHSHSFGVAHGHSRKVRIWMPTTQEAFI